jgi:hypothetical protein
MKPLIASHQLLQLLMVPAVVVLALTVAGCGATSGGSTDTAATPDQGAVPTQTPEQASSPASSTPPGPSSLAVTGTPIIIDVDDQQIAGELDDSAASASLIGQLPLTLSFRDFGGQEKVAELPESLNLDGAPAGSDAAPGTIGYYVPDQGLVLYYDQVGYYPGIVPLGTLTDAGFIEDQASDFTVTIRSAE